MKQSRYNIWIERNGKEYVYNGITGSVLEVPKGTEAALKHTLATAQDDSLLDAELFSRMRQGAMVLPDEIDELGILRSRYDKARTDTSRLALTIISSLACNLKCPYCYESKEPNLLTPEVSTAILLYLSKIVRRISGLNVHWLGGEPLLAKKQLLSLSDAIISLCKTNNVSYRADVTTNGVLLDASTVAELSARGVTDAQVSLDGPAMIHNLMRPTNTGGETFHRILSNIKQAIDYVDVTVRVNVDKDNINYAEELLGVLADAGLSGKITIYLGQLVPVNDGVASPSASYRPACFNSREFSEIDAKFSRTAMHYGFNGPALSQPIATPCTAVRSNEFIVGSHGELYKCWKSVGNHAQIIGNILDFEQADSRARRWLDFEPFSDEECLNCIALPVCMGGCPHHAMDQRLYASRCSTFRFSHKEQLLQFVDSLSRTGSGVSHVRHLTPSSRI